MSFKRFLEEHHIPHGFPSGVIAACEDIFAGDPESDVLNMEVHRGLLVICIKNAGATGTATLVANSCDDTTPSTQTAIPFKERHCTIGDTFSAWADVAATGHTTTAGADQVYEYFIDAEDLSGTDKFVNVVFTEGVDSPCDGHIMTMLIGPRYSKSVPDSVLS